MSVGRGIAVANIESVKHGIEKDSWIVARGVRTTVRSSSGNRVMHECFVFGPDHEELAKNFALKLFGEGERLSACVFRLNTRVFTVNTPPPGGNPLPVGDGNWTG